MKNHKDIYTRLGFWVLIVLSILLNIIYLMGQTMAIISYDFTVAIGLQEPSSDITQIGVALNKGFGFGDTVIYLPLFIIGIIGLIKRQIWGSFSMIAALGITVYWPVVSLATVFYAMGSKGWNFTDYTAYTIILSSIVLFGIWGLTFLFRNRHVLLSLTGDSSK